MLLEGGCCCPRGLPPGEIDVAYTCAGIKCCWPPIEITVPEDGFGGGAPIITVLTELA